MTAITSPRPVCVLAGDIGGTKTALQLVDGDDRTLHARRYESARFEGLSLIVQAFLAEAASQGFPAPVVAAFGIAGPVVDGQSKATNLPWHLDERDLADACGLRRVRLMNDFVATAYGVLGLPVSALVDLQTGHSHPGGPIAVIGAGTGLGEALLVNMAEVNETQNYRVVASEGGHADFAPRDETEIDLLRHLKRRFGRVSWERVVSGQGIVNIYEFLRDTGVVAEAANVAREMLDEDWAAVIGRHALAGTDPLCMRAIDIFVTSFGAEAGNLALAGVATGGVYLTGGIAPKLLPRLQDGAFLRSYRDKGRLSDIVEKSPVRVVLDQETPLRGAAFVATRMALP